MEKSYIVDSLALKKGKISLQLSLNDFVYARENNGGTNSFENPRSWLHYSNDGLIRKYSFLMKEGLSVFPVPIP
jgi:hypothetical protein